MKYFPTDPCYTMRVSGRDLLSLALAAVADTIRCHVAATACGNPDLADDLESVANIATINAYHRYDPNGHACWTTYAEHSIVGAIRNYLTRQGRPICDCSGAPALCIDDLQDWQTDNATPIAALATSARPTVQRRVRMTSDIWDALELLSSRQNESVSVTIQTAVMVFLTYAERELVDQNNR